MITQNQRNVFVPDGRIVHIDTINRLRQDDAWKGAVQHLEQGLLGLGIRYEDKRPVVIKTTDESARREIVELRRQLRDMKRMLCYKRPAAENAIKSSVLEMNEKVAELRQEMKKLNKVPLQKAVESKTEVKKTKPRHSKKSSKKTSIQISNEFKQLLKAMKGEMTYEELLKERMCA
ncbi:MAG: hypothetical protein JW700_00755 [Candidatus Aenigmarchaeota archaeon]|nr:hypothetical protein [Candidatus Aenigmarchaeota archaeon]